MSRQTLCFSGQITPTLGPGVRSRLPFCCASISFSSQAISHSVSRIEGTGANASAALVDRTQYDLGQNLGMSLTASNTLSLQWAGYKDMSVQIMACLLCLMIVGGSLDRLPDPPAVKPHANQNNLVSRLDYHVAVAANHASDCPAAAPHFQDSLFLFRQIFESTGSSHKLTFVRQATDTSPPCFS